LKGKKFCGKKKIMLIFNKISSKKKNKEKKNFFRQGDLIKKKIKKINLKILVKL
jgi:hypothetical protein